MIDQQSLSSTNTRIHKACKRPCYQECTEASEEMSEVSSTDDARGVRPVCSASSSLLEGRGVPGAESVCSSAIDVGAPGLASSMSCSVRRSSLTASSSSPDNAAPGPSPAAAAPPTASARCSWSESCWSSACRPSPSASSDGLSVVSSVMAAFSPACAPQRASPPPA